MISSISSLKLPSADQNVASKSARGNGVGFSEIYNNRQLKYATKSIEMLVQNNR